MKHDEIEELIHGYLDASLSPAETEHLQNWIKESKDNAKRFAEAAILHDRLEAELKAQVGDEEIDDSTEVDRLIQFPVSTWLKAATGIAAAIVLLISFLPSIQQPSSDIASDQDLVLDAVNATLIQADEVKWANSSVLELGAEIGRQRLEIQSGILHLQFVTGVDVSIQGPASFEIINSREARLHSGLLTSFVPPGAEGFKVHLPNAEVTDLGTSFGIQLDKDGASKISVFDGLVEVATPNQPTAERVTEGEVMKVSKNQEMTRVEFDPLPFERIWPASSGIANSSDVFRFTPPWPKRIRYIESDTNIFVIPEGHPQRLQEPLPVNLHSPGEYSLIKQLEMTEIEAGARVRSFVLHYSPVESLPRGTAKRIEGSITFHRPIKGIIALKPELIASTGKFSNRHFGERQERRQLDFTGHPSGDRIELSQDMKTLHLSLSSPYESSDLLRVLVEVPPRFHRRSRSR